MSHVIVQSFLRLESRINHLRIRRFSESRLTLTDVYDARRFKDPRKLEEHE